MVDEKRKRNSNVRYQVDKQLCGVAMCRTGLARETVRKDFAGIHHEIKFQEREKKRYNMFVSDVK